MNTMSMLGFLVVLSSSSAFAATHHGTPNCDVAGKKVHVKGKAQCDKKKGTFLEEKTVDVKAPVAPTNVQVAPKPEEAAPVSNATK